ncbi:MAG: hypothetical protein HY318_16640 [Armatimonadetes bacterium]|nr:hypothetical protein [Armatimonadota bacterium]
MSNAITIGSRRELFWDEYLIDTEQTTAELKLHRPRAEEVVIDHKEAWEGDGCYFHCIVKDDGLYRMYYLGLETVDPEVTRLNAHPPLLCYAESTDGRNWVKPKLGICEFDGSKENNIIALPENDAGAFGHFPVFKDTNPDCPPEELYKGVAPKCNWTMNDCSLWCFTSADGIHFKKAWPMTDCGSFDNLNSAFWDKYTNQYVCYIRDYHNVFPPGEDLNNGIRDIRRMVSKDFKNWTVPVLLDFGDVEDYPLYTNVIQPYHRADGMLIGFPTRYVERNRWTANFDQLPGVDRRKKRMELEPRYGLATTDCLFISSRDGQKWKRWDEAFMTPGPEREYNWVYGDCGMALGLIETPSDLPGAPNELSMHAPDNHWGMIPAKLRRYTIRMDGFVSYHAPYQPGWFPSCKVVTKPFVFTGGKLSINFATSAAGYVKIGLIGESEQLLSIEMFGDSLDRTVDFEGGDVASLSNKPIRMEITMSDADIYSFIFSE